MGTAKNMFEPIKGSRAFEEVAERIKKQIFDQVLNPGDRLPPETQMASQFQVGRQTMREALRLLEMSGLITIQKGGGGGAFINDAIHYTISDLFLDAYRMHKVALNDLTEARMEVEKLVLDHVLERIRENDLARLKKNVAQAKARIEQGEMATEENVEFHRIFAAASQNFVYVIIMECLMAANAKILSKAGVTLETSARVVQSHQDLVEAIENKDAPRAHELISEHLLDVEKRLLAAGRDKEPE
jgi:DNA-binding FadR family transcriptional regulator